jgi:hypothetical protein
MSQFSNEVLASFVAGASIPAYTVVELSADNRTVANWTATTAAGVAGMIIGVTKDVASAGQGIGVVIGGTARVLCNASISAGAIVGPVSATAGLIQAVTLPTTVTGVWPNTLGIALESGSTNAVIDVLLQVNNAVLTR